MLATIPLLAKPRSSLFSQLSAKDPDPFSSNVDVNVQIKRPNDIVVHQRLVNAR